MAISRKTNSPCNSKIIIKLKIPVYGNGLNERDWLFVGDHVKALIHLSKYGKLGEKYNIGLDKTLTNITLVKKICKILDNSIIKK